MGKARKQKLKVFRTPIGFHDAYVAAPSQKAALEAWGADSNLFAQGVAEQVTEPELTEEPLAKPGEVIRRLRGTADDHVAALAKSSAAKKKAAGGGIDAGRAGKAKASRPARPPKPDRSELEAAEAAIAAAEKRHRAEIREIDRHIDALERRRGTLQRRHETEHDELADKRDRARSAYDRAVRPWKQS